MEIDKQDLRHVSKTVLQEFIETYRQHPALWQMKNKEIYNNRNLKLVGYKALLRIWKKHEPVADISMVKQKIQSLRGSFRKELRKVQQSEQSFKGSDEVYKPSLWYYNLLHFLNEEEQSTESMANVDAGKDNSQDIQEEEVDEKMVDYAEASIVESPKIPTAAPDCENRKRKYNESTHQQFMEVCTEALPVKDQIDEFTAAGINVAAKLRKMNLRQQLLAECLINKILMMGLLNELTKETDIFTPTSLPTISSVSQSTNSLTELRFVKEEEVEEQLNLI